MLQRSLALVLVLVVFPGCESRTEFRGETRLSFRFDPADSAMSPDALRSELVGNIERRLRAASIRQFRVQSKTEQEISVDVPSTVSDLGRIKQLVTTGGRLTFHLVPEGETADADLDRYEDDERKYLDALAKQRQHVREADAKEKAEPALAEPQPPVPVLPARIVRRNADEQRMLLENIATAHLSVAALKDASVVRDESGRWALGIEFTSQDATRFAILTQNAIGRHLAIVLDDRVLTIPVIHSRIDARAMITATFDENKVQDIAALLEGGSLPAKLEFASEEPLDTPTSE
jgi:preprotein translocase subunit SecD